ncbi:MAG: elongation factor G [Verrucomicrobiales bacterium]|nr:elongation factor G [Verrucomicrobiales bacterium]
MKTYQASEIRNFAVVGHATSGKTMLCEAMLATAGEIGRMGAIANGSTVSDYHPGEKLHQISIHATPLHLEWLGRKLNPIDTPGYMDFISEALVALQVGDFALVVVHAVHGPALGTDTVWRYATKYGIPKILVVNGCDRENVDPEAMLAKLRTQYGPRVFPLTWPVNPGPGFNQELDVMRSEIVTYAKDGSGKYTEQPVDGVWKERVTQWHRELIEYTAEADDSLMEKFFEKGSLTEDELRAGEHTALQKQAFVPVFFTSAETNVGVARLLDFIAKYGSSPIDRMKVAANDADGNSVEVALTGTDPVLYVFKTTHEDQFGDLSFFRVYSGSVHVNMDLFNSDRKVNERIGQIYALNGRNRAAVEVLNAGDIGAAVKLRDTHTGNTLCSPKRVVAIPKMVFPKPNVHMSLKLKAKGEEDKLAAGLAALHDEDPTFHYHVDAALHQTVISGQGELHLQIVSERLKRRYRVDFDLTEPRIPYRETIRGRGESKYRHKKQTGGAGQFAEVWMRVEPLARNSGVEFSESLTGQNVDRVFVPSVEKGVSSACVEGVLAGYPVVDVKIDFYDGKMHPVDSKDIAFQIAGKEAFKEAFRMAKPCLLEPIYNVEVRIPDDFMGNVLGDLSSRRGRIQGMDSADGYQIVKALVPQNELYLYSASLRSLTGGRGYHLEEFSHYDHLPAEREAKVVAESKKAHEEEKSA